MRGDRFMFTAFAIGYLGWRRALKFALAGGLLGVVFLITMWVLDNPAPVAEMPVLTHEQMIRTWSTDKQTRAYLLSIGICCPHCEKVPQCNN